MAMQFKKSDKFFSRNLSNPLQNQENEAHINPDNCSIGCMRHTGTTIRLKAAAKKKKNSPGKASNGSLYQTNFQFQKTRIADAKAIKHLSVVSSNKRREKKKWME
ncbi:hypothetical protein CEXT_680121 [Caerostris extrusa]|uniref:Ribosomal protein L28 n=1 Tax=Caerostris extrusa TaxID=172846 RepID=A0AAV4P9G1_CAEEX|nr:hypothetical protein CEXT_680121 [Caerostris extrusa]